MMPVSRSIPPVCCICFCLLLIPGAGAFTVGSAIVSPETNLFPGYPVNISCTVYAAAGTAFPSYDDLQMVTVLDDPSWMYTISVNGVKNSRPVTGGHTVTISGFELGYRNQDEVTITVMVRGNIPKTAPNGANLTLLKIQELDSRGYAIPSSIVTIDHLVGEPTPPPTPAYGSIAVTTIPAGADLFIDNVYKGLSPAVFDSVPNGNHLLRIRLRGYSEDLRNLYVTGNNQTVRVTLVPETTVPATPSPTGSPFPSLPVPAAGYGSLSVTTIPPGALVYVDGVMKGVSPATIPMLPTGMHSVRLILDGYDDLTTTITVNEGTTSEYITGLSKARKTPGFGVAVAVLAAGLLVLLRRRG